MSDHVPGRSTDFTRDWQPDSDIEEFDVGTGPKHVRANWPLWVGGIIVALVAALAILGPRLAPQDPMQENLIIQVGDEWETPPFTPLAVPGFPLGSDQFGRDLLSRLLWAVRPTLIMVITVAAVRLVLGIAIGMGAGWSSGRVGHALDAAIGAALSVPVLIVALAAIAVIGVEYGLLAFVVGLSLTGWVETARFVREQTQLVKGQQYIEAARALGASDTNILLTHVLRQIMPMLWMLFSFEISNTLMTTAGLGFLGYYIGGEVWIDVDDFVARRLSGMPELGQMLAAAWSEQQVITEPWAMIVAGSAIFVAIVGFTLLGEGLRLRLGVDRPRRRGFRAAIGDRIRVWASVPSAPSGQLARRRFLVTIALVGFVLLAGIVFLALANRETEGPDQATATGNLAVSDQDQHLWPVQRHDAQGTLWSDVRGPVAPGVQWIFRDPSGFSGGPAVSRDETLFISSKGGTLYALDASGNVAWKADLPSGGVGTPALDNAGNIYVADELGGLTALSPSGEILWNYQPDAEAKATTSPIVSKEGIILYPAGGTLRAVSTGGELSWEARAPYGFDPLPPLMSPKEDMLFFLATAFNPEDGSILDMSALTSNAGNEQYVIGADGETYYRSVGRIIHWALSGDNVEIIEALTRIVPGHPKDVGTTADGIIWAVYGVGYNSPDSGIVWLDRTDQVLGNIEFQQDPAAVIGVGKDGVVYTCGNNRDDIVECIAVEPGVDDPSWRFNLAESEQIVGGALVPGKLFVATKSGSLFAVADQDLDGKPLAGSTAQPPIIVAQQPPPTATATPTERSSSDAAGDSPAVTPTYPPTPTAAAEPTPTASPPLEQTRIFTQGEVLTYTLSVVNNGPSIARGVILTDTLPSGVELLDAETSQGTGCRGVEGILICELGDLADQDNATITLTMRIESFLPEGITNTATIGSLVPDPDQRDNSAHQQARVQGGSDLAASLTAVRAPTAVGEVLTYTATITNLGPLDATDWQISSTLLPGFSLHLASVSPGLSCDANLGGSFAPPLRCTASKLARGEGVEVVLSVEIPITYSLGELITHTLAVTSTSPDPNPDNNSFGITLPIFVEVGTQGR